MKDYLFLAGQIRALESKLLSSAQIERMVGAADPLGAFRVFTELQYAEYLDQEVKPEQFGIIIDKGLQETKQLITKGTDNAPELQVIWKEFDLNNIKRALKQVLIEEKTTLENFSEENGYSLLGDISQEDLDAVIFQEEEAELFPQEYVSVIRQAKELYEDAGNFRVVEFALDAIHFEYLMHLAKASKSTFLKKYIQLKADLVNTKTLVRLFSSEQEAETSYFLSHGKIPVKAFLETTEKKSLVDLLEKYEYFSLAESFKTCFEKYEDEAELILNIERVIASYYETFLIESEEGVLGTVEIPMVYFLKRVKNARVLKFIMFSKLYGLAPEQIYRTLKHL